MTIVRTTPARPRKARAPAVAALLVLFPIVAAGGTPDAKKPGKDCKPGEGAQATVAAAKDSKTGADDALVISVGTLHVGDGRKFVPGELLVVDGKVKEVGEHVTAPAGARRWDEPSAVLTPGLVDASVPVPVGGGEDRGGLSSAMLTAADARSPWDAWLPLVRGEGIAAACLAPAGRGAISGRAATMGTTGPGAAGAPLLRAEAALVASVSAGARGSGERTAGREALMRSFEQADEYAKTWKEWRTAHPDSPATPKGKTRPRRAEAPLSPAELAKKPRTQDASEVMLRVLDGKLPLRIEANRREEVEDALDLARSRGLSVVLTGCVECGELADELAASQVIVLLEPLTAAVRKDAYGTPRPDVVRRLAAAGARVAISGGGPWPSGPGWLRVAAAEAVGLGLSNDQAISAITSLAAEASGIGDTHGLIATGRPAEVVLWTGDPLDPQSTVRRFVSPDDTRVESGSKSQHEAAGAAK